MSVLPFPYGVPVAKLPFRMTRLDGTLYSALPTGGTWTITFDSYTTGALALNASPASVQAALEALPSPGSGNVTVSGEGFPYGDYSVEFNAALGDVPELTIDDYLLGGQGGAVTVLTEANGDAGLSEEESLTVIASSGNFTLYFDGYTTESIACDADAGTVQSRLNALPSIGGGVACSGGPLGSAAVQISFQGALGNRPVTPITGDFSGLSGWGEIQVVQAGCWPVAERQRLSLVYDRPEALIVADGATEAALANLPDQVGLGHWCVDLTAQEMSATLIGLMFTAAGCAPEHVMIATTREPANLGALAVHSSGTVRATDSNGAALATASTALSSTVWTALRASYLDRLNFTGLAASSAEVVAIQNNTRCVRVVPTILQRPAAGSSAFRFELLLYDSVGQMEAPNSAPTVSVANQAGASRDANLDSTTMSYVSQGRYRCTYTVAGDHPLEELIVSFMVVEGASGRYYANATVVADTVAVNFTPEDRGRLAAIHEKLPSAPYLRGTQESDGQLAAADVALIAAAIPPPASEDIAAIRAKTDLLPVNPAGTGAAMTLTAGERQAIADAVLARDVACVEAAAAVHSLCYTVLAMSAANTTANAGKLTVYRTDGVTEFARKTISTSANAAAVTGVS